MTATSSSSRQKEEEEEEKDIKERQSSPITTTTTTTTTTATTTTKTTSTLISSNTSTTPSPSPSPSPASSNHHQPLHHQNKQGQGHHHRVISRAQGRKRRVLQRIVTGRGGTAVVQQKQPQETHPQRQRQQQQEQGSNSGEQRNYSSQRAGIQRQFSEEQQQQHDDDEEEEEQVFEESDNSDEKTPPPPPPPTSTTTTTAAAPASSIPSSVTTTATATSTSQQHKSRNILQSTSSTKKLKKKWGFTPKKMSTSTGPPPQQEPSPTARLEELLANTTLREASPRLVEVTSSSTSTNYKAYSSNNYSTTTRKTPYHPLHDFEIFTKQPLVKDLLQTKTSIEQDSVSIRCQQIHADPYNPLPHLNREAHETFLQDFLGLDQDGDQLPPGFVMLDASRPWLLYWCLIGLHCLGSDLAVYRERLIDTLRPIQNATGGFGGGNGQKSHVAVSYAAVLSLCTVGGKEAFELIDRVSMWRWLSGLKQVDGGFRVCEGGEEDVRGAYCALTLISLLGLPTQLAPEDAERLRLDSKEMCEGRKMPGYGHDPKNVPKNLLDGVPEYLGRCQTYEGGIAGGPGGMEAHGGYAFCSLAALCLLGEPKVMLNKYLNLPKLINWLSARQYAPEGGFSGRTNKLVDGCYSTWVGGCWALVEAALNGPQEVEEYEGDGVGRSSVPTGEGTELVGSLWSRDGLVKYILGCCQDPRGGLRDKPGKSADQYHSAYILLGLSSAQNYQYYVKDPSIASTFDAATHPPTTTTTASEGEEEDITTCPPTPRAAFLWRTSHYIPKGTTTKVALPKQFESERVLSTYSLDDPDMVDYMDLEEDDGVGEELAQDGVWWYGDRVRRAHPIFNVPHQRVREWSRWVWGDEGTEGEGEGEGESEGEGEWDEEEAEGEDEV